MNPIFLGCAVLCVACAVFAPAGVNVLFAWLGYMYFKMSAE